MNTMTQENKETKFDVREIPEYKAGHIETAAEASATESPTKHDLNSIYGKIGRPVRPMIKFVNDTTEARLRDAREQMTFTRAKKTIRNTGHYFTEPYPACGVCCCCAVPKDGEAQYGV